jgi:uncharacterized protein (TIGR03435 family)
MRFEALGRISRVGAKVALPLLTVLVLGSNLQSGKLRAQSATEGSDSFEVASIRPSNVNGDRSSVEFPPDGFRATNVSLKELIQVAYGILPEQLSGGESWTDSNKFTVLAKSPESDAALPESARQELTLKRLQLLLRDRFHLVLSVKPDSASGYVMTVAKSGHKMTPDNDAPGPGLITQNGLWKIRAKGTRMSILAMFLGAHLDEPVTDKTGLEGGFTFELNWTPVGLSGGMSRQVMDNLAYDYLIPAVQKQLGLTLRREKSAADRYRIDRAETPTEN